MKKYSLFLCLILLAFVTNLFANLEISDRSGSVISKSGLTINKQGVTYLAIEELSNLFPAALPYNLKIANKSVLFSDSSSYFAVDKKIFNLSYDCFKSDNKLYFPLESFIFIFNQVTDPEMITLSKDKLSIRDLSTKKTKTIIEKSSEPKQSIKTPTKANSNINSILISEKKNGTSITFQTSRQFTTGDISISQNKDNSFYLTIYKGLFDATQADSIPLAGVIKKLSVNQLKQSLQVNFELKRELLSRSILIQKDKITLNLITEKATEITNAAILKKLESEKNSWKIDNIIIDSGHGGKDPGAVGKSGVYEKDITLKIAKYLDGFLTKDGSFKTHLTRDDDRFVELKERTKIANSRNGKLFVSIHCNANKSPKHSGFETYFLKPARTESAMEVAALENSVIKYEADKTDYKELTDQEYIILSMMQANFVKESESWATRVQKRIAEFSEYKERGVDQAGFYVLVGASMPAILVEAGFISNLQEEKSLKTAKYQKQIAEAIYKSILDLRQKAENGE